MRRQLKLRRVSIAVATDFRATRKRRTKCHRHTRSRNDRRASRVFETKDQLRRNHARRSIELPLKHGTTLHARLLRVHALPFAKRQLIGNVARQISKSRRSEEHTSELPPRF